MIVGQLSLARRRRDGVHGCCGAVGFALLAQLAGQAATGICRGRIHSYLALLPARSRVKTSNCDVDLHVLILWTCP